MEKIKKFSRVPIDVPLSDLNPLNIKCTSTKCEDGLHCFKPNKKTLKQFGHAGCCKDCGKELVEWDRVHNNDIGDAKYVFESMRHELIRHVFWHVNFEDGTIEKAQKKGFETLKSYTKTFLKSKIGKTPDAWDGRQTTLGGNNIVTYAQHATATCCRKCAEYWHNIPRNRPLSEMELEYCAELVMLYIKERIPSLIQENAEEIK